MSNTNFLILIVFWVKCFNVAINEIGIIKFLGFVFFNIEMQGNT